LRYLLCFYAAESLTVLCMPMIVYSGVVKSPVRRNEEHIARATQELSTRCQIWERWTWSQQVPITG